MVPPLKRERLLKLTLAYDGTDFVGWQRQQNGRSVQEVLEQVFHRITGKKVVLVGAGRTDSGVHAQGQVAHLTIAQKLSLPILLKALNANLPEDVVVLSLSEPPKKFHARYAAKRKWYRYVIWNSALRPVLDRTQMTWIPARLDITKMKKAARLLKGRHDFKIFNSGGRDLESTVRTLYQLRISQNGSRLMIDAQADGFLYHMVRRIAGLLIDVGRGKIPDAHVKELLAGRSHTVPHTAAAKGLSLMKVWY